MERLQHIYECRMETRESGGNETPRKYTIVGTPIVFGRVTDIGPYNEVILREALNDPDALRDVVLLTEHRLGSLPLARSRRNNGSSTMSLTVDDDGLHIEADLDVEHNADAAALYSAVQRGDIYGMSFGFFVDPNDGDSWDWSVEEHPTRTIHHISRIVEVSAVAFAAYDETQISTRSADVEALDNAKTALDNAKKAVARKRELIELKLKLQ